MQREAMESEVARWRNRRIGALCALCLTPWLALSASGSDTDVPKYDTKGPGERTDADELDPYAGWLENVDATEELDAGRPTWDTFDLPELDPNEVVDEMTAASGTGDSSPCVITLNTIVPANATVGTEVEIRVDATAPSPGTVKIGRYDVDFGDGVKVAYAAPPFKHSYALEGWYSVTVNVVGSVLGVTTTTCRSGTFYGLHTPLQVKPASLPGQVVWSSYRPSIGISPTGSLQVGDEISFTAISGMPASEEAKYPLYYRWSIGDGTTASDRTVQRTFAAPGTFTASLEVYAYASGSWEQVGSAVQRTYTIERGLNVVGYIPDYMGRIRDLAFSEYADATRANHQAVWSVGATRIAIVNVDDPRAPKLLGGLRTMQVPWAGTPAPTATGTVSVAATDKLVAISDATYGIFLLDAQTAPTSTGALIPFARVDRWAAADLAFDSTGGVLFAVTPNAIRAYDVSKWLTAPRVQSLLWSAPTLAQYSEAASFTGLSVNGNLLYVGQARPLAFDVFEFGDLDLSVAGKEIVRRSQLVGDGTQQGGAMAPPRDFAVSGNLVAVNENWLVFGTRGYTAFYDLSDPRHPTLRSRQGQAQAGVAMLKKADRPFAYSTDMAYLVEMDASTPRQETQVELAELSYNGVSLGRGSKVLADPRNSRLYIGATGSAVIVVDVK